MNDIERANIQPSGVHDGDIPQVDLDAVKVPDRPEIRRQTNFWRDKPLGRTLSLRNKTGKTIAGAASVVIGLLTGINIDPVTQLLTPSNGGTTMEFSWIELALMALTTLIGFGATRLTGLLKDVFAELQDIVSAIKKAREATSPGGKDTTPEEQRLILKEVDDLVMVLYKRLLRSRIGKWLGFKHKAPEQ